MASAPKSLPKAIAFFQLFRGHWETGTGRGADAAGTIRGWIASRFLTAMTRAAGMDGKKPPVSISVVEKWSKGYKTGQPFPSDKNMRLILEVFFGKEPCCDDLQAGRREMEAAWCAAQEEKSDQRRTVPRMSIAAGPMAPVWVAEPVVQVEGLVEIIVNQPVLNNEGTEMRLPGTIVIDGGFTQPHGNRVVHIGVEEVDLTLETPSHPALPNTRFRHAVENLGAKPAAGGVRVNEPRTRGGWLDGSLLEDGTIATLEAAGNGDKPIAVRVLARADRFVVHDVSDGKPPRLRVQGDAKNAVVGAIIRVGREVDGQDRVAIARARLARRKGE